MSGDRELRARLEALQAGIKTAKAALDAGVPAGFTEELAARTAESDEAEEEAARVEAELAEQRAQHAALRDECERAEQAVLAPQATSSVPAVSVLLTFALLPAAVWACVMVTRVFPRSDLLIWAVKGVALAAPLTLAWLAKRRLMEPKRAPVKVRLDRFRREEEARRVEALGQRER